MNVDSYTKIRLLEMIKGFMYDPKLSDLHIFSKQYLGSILYSMYKEDAGNTFCFAFGDLDKVRNINDKYSIQVGDRVIHDGLQIIRNTLPDNCKIARVAGDEFIFITDNTSKKEMDAYIKKINTSLSDKTDGLHGLNITMSAMDSSIFSNFLDLYDFTETDVTAKKKKIKQHPFTSKDEILDDKIINGFRNYFNYYRLNDFKTTITFPDKYMLTLRDSIIDIIINRLEGKSPQLGLYFERLNTTLPKELRNLKYYSIPTADATNIHQLTAMNFLTSERLNTIDTDTLKDVSEFLTRDPLTGEYSKEFFDKFLLGTISKQPEKELSIQVFDLLHLKLSNDVINHNKTDEKISELFGSIINRLKQDIDFSDADRNTGNYLVSFGNKLLCVETGDFSVSESEINETIAKARTNQRILDILPARAHCKNSDVIETIQSLEESCLAKKHELKIEKISQEETVVPLSIALNDCINYYLDNFSNPLDLENKQKFTVKLFEGMAEVVSERYRTQKTPNFNNSVDREK